MKFYNRDAEIEQLHQLSRQAYSVSANMTFLVGRRRVGKTELLKHSFNKDPSFLYFFVARQSEVLLCDEFKEILAGRFELPGWAKLDTFLHLFEYILQHSIEHPLTVVFDEFQDFKYISPAIFSGMQNLWDTYKNKSKIHLICCGSVYSVMCDIFENNKEPLYGRADTKILLRPFKTDCIKEILMDSGQYTPKNLLTTYTIVGGIPRYLELLYKNDAWDLKSILSIILRQNSFFLTEGKDVLIDEFGKDYKTYFSILSLIASGKTARSAIESVLQISVGGYIDKLENEFSVIKKYKPIFANEAARTQKYYIQDNFLNFWFRYIHKHQSAVEIANFKYITDIVAADFSVYSGKYLEFIIMEILAASGSYNNLGSYWERDGSNEIDIIACNDRDKTMLIAEVKLQNKNISLGMLKQKAHKIAEKYSDYDIQYKGFSLDSLDTLLHP